MQAYMTMDQSLERIFALYYGPWGSGKSWSSWTWPNPVIVEASRGELKGARVRHIDMPVLRPTSWEDIQTFYSNPPKVIEEYFPGYDAKTIVIDTISQLSDTICMRHCLKVAGKGPDAVVKLPDIGAVVSKMRGFFVLSQELKYNVVGIMHERTEKNDLTGEILTQPDMYGTSIRGACGTYVDIVLHFQQERRSPTPDNPATKEYVAYPVRDSRAHGKDRFDCLPARIVNPNYPEFRRLIDAKEAKYAAAERTSG